MHIIIRTLCILIFLSTTNAHAVSLLGRLGIGMAQPVPNQMKTISLKLQNSRASALGAFIGVDSGTEATDYAVGLKSYRIVYEEPQLNFYMAGTGGVFSYQDDNDKTSNGYIVEAAFGSEFHLQGLESIGFSFEFGLGLHKVSDGTEFKTIGHNSLTSAVHFYL